MDRYSCQWCAPTKTLAKIANIFVKKYKLSKGVFDWSAMDHYTQDEILRKTDVQDIWGVGCKYAASLKKQGIFNAEQLKNSVPKMMRQKYSVLMEKMILELSGTACIALEQVSDNKKTILSSRSFGKAVSDKQDIKNALLHHIHMTARKLRRQGSVATMISFFIRPSYYETYAVKHYKKSSWSISFDTPTSSTFKFIEALNDVIDHIYEENIPYKKAGVMLSNISDDTLEQHHFFADLDPGKRPPSYGGFRSHECKIWTRICDDWFCSKSSAAMASQAKS